MKYDKGKISTIICEEYAKFVVEEYIKKYGIERFNKIKHIFANIAADMIIKSFLNKKTALDEEIEFRSTENGVKFPLEQGKSTKESCKKFFKQKENKKEIVPLKDLMGEEFKGVKGQHAINKIYKEQKGHVKAAFHRSIGDIDIMWGDGTCGLSHILKQRNHRSEDAHQLLHTIGKVIQNGRIAKDKTDSSRWCISYMGKRAIISTELRNEKAICLLTGFFT